MEPSACRIRAMTTMDLDPIVELEKRLQSHPWRRGHFENCLAIGNLALIVEPEVVEPDVVESNVERDKVQNSSAPTPTIIAFAIVSIGGGEAELLNIGVAPDFQRRGFAERLIKEITTHIQSLADTLFLEVRESNERAIALYEKLGFNQIGVRPAYYAAAKGREDALLYGMTLL